MSVGLGLGQGSGVLAQPLPPSLTPSVVSPPPLISGTLRTSRLYRPEGNGPGFGGEGAREVCGPFRLQEGDV